MDYKQTTAKILIDIKAINFNFQNPFILTSGRKSPVYVDCRKIISFTKERNLIIQFMENYLRDNKIDFDLIAGGETAGIPYAAFLAERLQKPMIYIRKKPKGFGKKSQIEGNFNINEKSILIEDLATDGKSKMSFIDTMRENKIKINDTMVIFFYGIFEKAEEELKKQNIKIHYLCTWHDILDEIKKEKKLENNEIDSLEKFLFNSENWTKNG
ncbi:MAG: Orotate phosphoribosyltransferase [Alphaproteobacteria bacterium MarineAlpha5_Bin12]|nr:orotate phosphoribosyltransferase [Pelagibacteraceae bacterium]PPR42149.1 MAG: Orotate phosphoribosyltransferase [Alphaproteobacteria bacterium MarineAlpha5_Bin12]